MRIGRLLIVALGFWAPFAGAACVGSTLLNSIAGKDNEIRWFNGGTTSFTKLAFCSSSWSDFGGSVTATACAKAGEIKMVSGEMYYCDGSVLVAFDSQGGTDGACSKSGEIRFNGGAAPLEWCNGSQWRTVAADTDPDPFNFISYTSAAFDQAYVSIIPITGFTSATANVTFSTGGCVSPSLRTCADSTCSTFVSAVTTNGSLPLQKGMYLRAAMFSAGTGNATCTINVSAGSQSSTYTVTTVASDTTVLYSATFTEVRSATPNSVVTSNIVKTTGHGDVTASISGGVSSQFRICADSACSTEVVTWGSASQTLSNYQYVQLRTTAGPGSVDLNRISFQAGTGGPLTWNVMNSTCPRTLTLAAGASQTCTCPPNYPVITSGVWGVGTYRQASDVCGAAVHVGAATNAAGGTITVNGTTAGSPSGTCPTFNGSNVNSIFSNAWSSPATSMYFSGFGSDVCN